MDLAWFISLLKEYWNHSWSIAVMQVLFIIISVHLFPVCLQQRRGTMDLFQKKDAGQQSALDVVTEASLIIPKTDPLTFRTLTHMQPRWCKHASLIAGHVLCQRWTVFTMLFLSVQLWWTFFAGIKWWVIQIGVWEFLYNKGKVSKSGITDRCCTHAQLKSPSLSLFTENAAQPL